MRTTSEKPRIHMLCGFICSGKSTFAQKLEKELKAVTFCLDEWMAQLFGQEHSDECGITYGPAVQSLMRKTYEQLLKLNIDIILDDGFWKKADRDRARKRAFDLGAKPQLYFLDCPKSILKQRLLERNANPTTDSVIISERRFEVSWKYFQPPGPDEEFQLVETAT